MSATTTQYEQHTVRCGCGKVHTATRPDGAGAGRVGYGPTLRAWCVYLMVVHAIPVHRCVALLESLTGAAPSVGFVHARDPSGGGGPGAGRPADPHPDHPGVRGVLR